MWNHIIKRQTPWQTAINAKVYTLYRFISQYIATTSLHHREIYYLCRLESCQNNYILYQQEYSFKWSNWGLCLITKRAQRKRYNILDWGVNGRIFFGIIHRLLNLKIKHILYFKLFNYLINYFYWPCKTINHNEF